MSADTTKKVTYVRVAMKLENCLLPAEKLAITPSEKDGLSRDMEIQLRIAGCEFIQTSGVLLRLPQVAMATGQILFQRFYYSKSFVRHSMEVVAMACTALASKLEEAPRRIRDVINVVHHIKQVQAGKTIQPLILDPNYINLKSEVVKAERRVLKELGFSVHVQHPHKIIVTILNILQLENQRLRQTAWNYMNDSLRSDVFLRYQPSAIACACIYLSARLLKVPLPNKPPWYFMFDVSEGDIQSICHTILALYTFPRPCLEKLEKIVEEMKKANDERKQKAKESRANGVHINASLSHVIASLAKAECSPYESTKKEENNTSENNARYEKSRHYRRRRSSSPEDKSRSRHYKKHKSSHSTSGSSHSPSPKHNSSKSYHNSMTYFKTKLKNSSLYHHRKNGASSSEDKSSRSRSTSPKRNSLSTKYSKHIHKSRRNYDSDQSSPEIKRKAKKSAKSKSKRRHNHTSKRKHSSHKSSHHKSKSQPMHLSKLKSKA